MSTEIIVLTGPESCGKTTLANALSDHLQAPCVDEAARSYLAESISYEQEDLLAIARQQQALEIESLAQSPPVIVCDTDLLVIMIWSEVKYDSCNRWITNTFETNQQDSSTNRFYCLCDYHVPWQPHPLRENPDNRDELFDLYLKKLEHYDLHYCIAKGSTEDRIQQVINSRQ